LAGSTASTPISPDIDEQMEARLAPFMWKTILDTRVLIAEDLDADVELGPRAIGAEIAACQRP
jgi:hypothetical protein